MQFKLHESGHSSSNLDTHDGALINGITITFSVVPTAFRRENGSIFIMNFCVAS
ncbi:16089_t:CDS:2 [Dentiscutata heterogama]|uniref:16089_t:CDS:1 n=1 Tax=Dentiscutata heterogama TaxID=1316150 RepID=A0ACA9K137_9GLOM|nr:16089_t:CDS:2 [Dentiscutata heterogama]